MNDVDLDAKGLGEQAENWVRNHMPAGRWRRTERDKAIAAFRAGWWAAVRTFADDDRDAS